MFVAIKDHACPRTVCYPCEAINISISLGSLFYQSYMQSMAIGANIVRMKNCLSCFDNDDQYNYNSLLYNMFHVKSFLDHFLLMFLYS